MHRSLVDFCTTFYSEFMFNSVEPMSIARHVTAVRLSERQLFSLDVVATRRRVKTGNRVQRSDIIREAIQEKLVKEGMVDDANPS